MTTFQELHWDSIKFLKDHLYRRLASPLNNALGRLAIAQHVDNPDEADAQFRRVEQSLEIALNLIKAWAALIHVQSGGEIHDHQRRVIAPDGLPPWLVDYLNMRTALRIEHTLPLFVHIESLYEMLLSMCQLGSTVGTLKLMSLTDAKGDPESVWVRAVFEPPPSGTYRSLNRLVSDLKDSNP
ncbi:MAG: hypothetical protein GYB65_06325, partial [Chloroflexi bacterium]|nr:hypothetical protein [Chloroflexota bacterium]